MFVRILTSMGGDMNEGIGTLGFLRKLDSSDLMLVVAVLVLAWVLAAAVRWTLRHAAEKVRPRLRLSILRVVPVARLFIGVGALVVIVPILVEPSFQNVVTLLASVGLAIAFVLKDYASSLVAGLVTVLENTYQPGDWIEMDGIYGEVKFIGVRAVHIVTADDCPYGPPELRENFGFSLGQVGKIKTALAEEMKRLCAEWGEIHESD